MLDLRTIFLGHLATGTVCTLVMVLLWWQNRKRYAGLLLWLADFALQLTAALLFGLRGQVPDWMSMIVSNTAIVTGALLGYWGLERFLGQIGRRWHNYTLLLVFVLVHCHFLLVQPNLTARMLNVSVALFLVFFQCLWLLLRRVAWDLHQVTRGVGLIFAAFALVSLTHIPLLLAHPHATNDFFRSGLVSALFLLTYQLLLILLTFGLVLLVNGRLRLELQSEEEKYAKAFHSSPYAITLSRLSDGRFVEVNEGFLNITGYARAAVVGSTSLDLGLWSREEDRISFVKELLQGRPVRGREYVFRKMSGEPVLGHISAEIMPMPGEPLILSSINDVTERRKAEETLRESAERLRQLNALQGLLLFANPIEKKGLLVTDAVAQIVGADFARVWLIKPGDRCETGCLHAQVAEGPHTCRFRDRCLHLLASSGRYTHTDGGAHARVPFGCYKIGKIAAGEEPGFLTNNVTADPRVHNPAWAKELGLVSFAGYRLTDTDGTPLGVLALFSQKPISGEQDLLLQGIAHAASGALLSAREEEALRANEARYRALVEHIPQKTFLKSKDCRFVSVNENFARDLGVRPEAVAGKQDSDFFPETLAAKYQADDLRVMATGQTEELEEVYMREGRQTWVNVVKTPVRDHQGVVIGVFGIFWDITARKKAEQQLKHTLAELERSNQELEQFAFVASHDLQEPLRMVANFTQLLAQRYEGQLDERANKYIHYAVDGALRMKALIDDLLAYSRVGGQGQPLETTSTQDALDEAKRNLATLVQDEHATITHGHLPAVRGDPAQLVMLFQNLLGNALKFHGPDLPRIHVSAQEENRAWVFSVQDNGIGIEPQHAERVFEVFQRLHTREEYPGTGIGLALCKRIVERHGGRIWFASEPGNGTTFFFTVSKT